MEYRWLLPRPCKCLLHTRHDLRSHACREEGDNLSRKNGELEAAVRKLRSGGHDLEDERDKLATRVKALESQLLEAQERAEKAANEASTQVRVDGERRRGGDGGCYGWRNVQQRVAFVIPEPHGHVEFLPA